MCIKCCPTMRISVILLIALLACAMAQDGFGTLQDQHVKSNGVDEAGCGLWQSTVESGRAPWYVKIYNYNDTDHYCPGTLVAPTIVLSDAECLSLYLINDYIIVTGQGDLDIVYDQRSWSVSIHIHPSFDGDYRYNLALVRLDDPIRTTSRVRPICVDLWNEQLNEELLTTGNVVREYNWGSYITTTLLDRAECRKNLMNLNASYNIFTEATICTAAGNITKCGAHLAISREASDGSQRWYYGGLRTKCFSSSGNYYTSIYHIREWIQEILPCGTPLTKPCPQQIYSYVFHPKAVTFTMAVEECSRLGGTLAVTSTATDHADLLREFKSRKGGYAVWLGITDRETEGVFKSIRDPSEKIYIKWYATEPNNSGVGGRDEDCVSMTFEGYSNDLPCEGFNPFFCWQPVQPIIGTTPSTTHIMPPPFKDYTYSPVTQMYYRFYDNLETHRGAFGTCLFDGAELPNPTNEREVLELLEHTELGTQLIWLDLTYKAGQYRSSNGSVAVYLDWYLDELNRLGNSEHCVLIKYSGKYEVELCDSRHPFVCVKRYETSTTNQQTVISGGCHLRELLTVDYTCFDANDNPIECGTTVRSGTKVNYHCKPYHVDVTSNYQLLCEDGAFNAPTPRCVPDCGTEPAQGLPFILGGEPVTVGTFPWHAGIYWKKNDAADLEQVCGGTLVRRNVIISAAHCFTYRSTLYPATEFAVAAGKLYRDWSHPKDNSAFVQKSFVKQILIPNTYGGLVTHYQSDIAIVELLTPFNFSDNVHTACLDLRNERLNILHLAKDSFGKVAGWGFTVQGGEPSSTLQTLSVPFIDYQECFKEADRYGFGKYLTPDKICAGYTNGSAVCQGDSGGGLVFPHRETALSVQRWYLRGVVSTGPSDQGFCRRDTYTSYMNTFYVKDWLINAFRGLHIYI